MRFGKKKKPTRSARDDWQTPTWTLDAIRDLGVFPKPGESVLEPAAGDGVIVRYLLENGISDVTAIEKRQTDLFDAFGRVLPEGLTLIRDDFLRWKPPRAHYDWCVMNPPYTFAFEFVTKAIEFCTFVLALLGSNFYYSVGRYKFNTEQTPDMHCFSERPKFDGWTNGTDMRDRAWYVYPGSGHHDLIQPRKMSGKKVADLTEIIGRTVA